MLKSLKNIGEKLKNNFIYGIIFEFENLIYW